MKELLFSAVAIIGVGTGIYFMPMGPSDGYSMTVKEAQEILLNAKWNKSKSNLPFGSPDHAKNVRVTSPSSNVVRWSSLSGGLNLQLTCTATLTAVSDNHVTVINSCDANKPWDDGALKITADMQTTAFNEFIDSTLDKRPYNDNILKVAAIGSVLKHQKEMEADLEKMNADMKERGLRGDTSSVDYSSQPTPEQMNTALKKMDEEMKARGEYTGEYEQASEMMKKQESAKFGQPTTVLE
jgi:hypothetical protein